MNIFMSKNNVTYAKVSDWGLMLQEGHEKCPRKYTSVKYTPGPLPLVHLQPQQATTDQLESVLLCSERELPEVESLKESVWVSPSLSWSINQHDPHCAGLSAHCWR